MIVKKLLEEHRIPWLGALLGAMVAAWVIFQSNGFLNSDGMVYIEAAKQFSQGAWKAGFALYNWPLYSLLIAAIHHATGLKLLASAHAITITTFALTSAGLLVLVRELGGNRRVMLAAALMLFAATPLVNNYLPMVLRDHGFLAAHVWSIVFLLRFSATHRWSAALAWGIIAAIATLFRIEGIVYLALLPLALLLRSGYDWRQNLTALAKANTFLAASAVLLGMALLLLPNVDAHQLGRLKDPLTVAQNVFYQLTKGLEEKADLYVNVILGQYLNDYGMPGLLLTLAYVVLIKTATSVGWPQLLFAAYSRLQCREPSANPGHAYLLGWLFAIGLINAVFIILSAFALPKRYLQPLGLIILIYAAFGATALFTRWRQKIGTRWIFPALTALLGLQLVLNLRPSDSRDHFEQNAAKWINTHVPVGSRIYYDYGRMRFYVNEDSSSREEVPLAEIERLITTGDIKQYDYLVVHVSRKEREHQQFMSARLGEPLAMFENRRGKRILIYRVQKSP